MYTAVKGIYENGKLTLTETPPEIEKSEVVVLFMQPGAGNNVAGERERGINLGSLAGKGYSIPDDFNAPLSDLEDYM